VCGAVCLCSQRLHRQLQLLTEGMFLRRLLSVWRTPVVANGRQQLPRQQLLCKLCCSSVGSPLACVVAIGRQQLPRQQLLCKLCCSSVGSPLACVVANGRQQLPCQQPSHRLCAAASSAAPRGLCYVPLLEVVSFAGGFQGRYEVRRHEVPCCRQQL
jgi:hypothetical protein